MRTADFEYDLPRERIARFPADRRDGSRLLVVRREPAPGRPEREDLLFPDLVRLVPPGDALVLNDTRVFPARLRGRKPTGARGEVLLLRPAAADGAPGETRETGPGADGGEGAATAGAGPVTGRALDADRPLRWEALVRPGGKLKPGRTLRIADGFRVEIEDGARGGGRVVRLAGKALERATPWELLDRHGEPPIPPYLDRPTVPLDRERYQTVYARRRGSVAAPTAGLHFTEELLGRLEERGVRVLRVTLHVGVGTFRPVEAERPEEHELHEELYRVDRETAAAIRRVRDEGGRIWAVGTTVVRTLESAVGAGGRVRAGAGRTDLFIHPPYRFRVVDRLVTNFHLPRSSLLMLVAAFGGHDRVMRAYRHAIGSGYRFYSYGDAMAVL